MLHILKNILFVALISTSQIIFSQRHWCTEILESLVPRVSRRQHSIDNRVVVSSISTLENARFKKKTPPNSDRNAHLAAHGRVIASEARWRYALNVSAARSECLSVSFDLLVRSVNIFAGTVSARVPVTLVDVVRAIRPREARCTRALVAALERATLGPVSTGRWGAIILSFAVLAWNKKRQCCSTSCTDALLYAIKKLLAQRQVNAYTAIQFEDINTSVLFLFSLDNLIFASFRTNFILIRFKILYNK